MLKNRLLALLVTFTLGQAIKAAEPVDLAMQERQNSGLLAVLSEDMLNAQIAPYLSLQDIARVRRTCRYLSKHFWDHERVLEFDTSYLCNKLADESFISKVLIGNVFRSMGRDDSSPYDCHSMWQLGLPNFIAKFKKYPNSIALTLNSNKLTEMPAEMQQLTQLKKLNLCDNQLSQQAVRSICLWFPQLQELALNGNNLTELPAEIQRLTQLKRLYFAGNKSLSQQSIRNICLWFSQLQELDLGLNGFTELPAEIQQLTRLKILRLWSNRLSQQAIRNICCCSQLQKLELAYNGLAALPTEIQHLTQLEELNLAGNKFNQATQEQIRSWLPNTDVAF